MSYTRKLASIMFTDIVGYTKLMQQSESEAIILRNRHRKVFESLHESHGGKIIQYYGDGTLSIFESAGDAVRCAIDIQRQLRNEPEVPLRIGIHLGEILMSDTDIIGNSVNIASRVESLGAAGAVLISQKVMDEIENQDELPCKFMGEFHFKNDTYPRSIYAISAPGILVPSPDQLSGKLQPLSQKNGIESIAVLPLGNYTGEENKEFIVSGIHDNLITAISRISSLRVISKTSTLRYKNTDKTIPEIAEELQVDAIFEGSVSSSNNNIQLNLQLIKVFPEEDHIWAETFERPLEEIFALLNDITQIISEQIGLFLTPKESERLTHSEEVDPEAYKAYLRGMFHLEKLAPEDIRIGTEYLETALSIDPNFAEAHAFKAFSLGAQAQMGLIPPAEAMPKMFQSVQKAMGLNPELGQAFYIKALTHSFVEWDWEKGEAAFLKVLDVNPNHSTARGYYGHALMLLKRFDEAIEQVSIALEIDPNNAFVQALAAVVFYHNMETRRALELAKKSYQIDPNSILVLRVLDMCYFRLGEYDKSIEIIKKMHQDEPEALKAIEEGYIKKDYKNAMLALARTKEKLSDEQYVQPTWGVAIYYSRIGYDEELIKWLERGLQVHDQDMPYVFVTAELKELKKDERFRRIAQKINVPLL